MKLGKNNNFIVQGHAQKIFRLPLNTRIRGTMFSFVDDVHIWRTIVPRFRAVFSSFTNPSNPAL